MVFGRKKPENGTEGVFLHNLSDFSENLFIKMQYKQNFCYVGFKKIFRAFFRKKFLKTAIRSEN